MIDCNDCHASQYPGTLFCEECGAFLGEVQGVGPRPDTTNHTLHVFVPSSGRQLSLSLESAVWIGRADPDMNFWPRLDLTEDGGIEAGVSRRHARIAVVHATAVIIDQHSANGTWLGGERLSAERPYTLPAEARVRFGRLQVQLRLE